MDLFATCNCGRRIPVTPAKCGSEVNCYCGKLIRVPPLGELRHQMANAPEDPQQIPNARIAVEESGPRPIRPIPMVFAILMFLYGMFQLLQLPGRLKMSTQIAVLSIGFTIGSLALSVVLYRASTKRE